MTQILNAGRLLRRLLLNVEKIRTDSRGVWPVIVPEGTELPYVCYRRKNSEAVRAVGGGHIVTFDVIIFDADYSHGASLAEAALEEFDTYPHRTDPVHVELARNLGRIEIVDSAEGWAGDSYYQQLTIKFRVA